MKCIVDRRRFLKASAASITLSSPAFRAIAQQHSIRAALKLHTAQTGPTVPSDFIGLSYETERLSDSTFFSPEHTDLVSLFQNLTRTGVLRLGGNSCDLCWWKPTARGTQPSAPAYEILSARSERMHAYAITPEAIQNLRKFLDATGWSCIFGINLGTCSPHDAAEQAASVAAALGPKLVCFQLGNEPDLFQHRFRDAATWGPDVYFNEWLAMANAIRAKVPNPRFGLPDTSGSPDWSTRIAERLSALRVSSCPCDVSPFTPCSCVTLMNAPPVRPHISLLSHHHHFGEPVSGPAVNGSRLLRPDPGVAATAEVTRTAALRLGVPYRLTQADVFTQGEEPAVPYSAAALWAADYALALASLGYAGLNLHIASGKMVVNSLGDDASRKAATPAIDQAPLYVVDSEGRTIAEPGYQSLSFFRHFAGAQMLTVDFDPGPVNATAYAAKVPGSELSAGSILLAFINKDEERALTVQLPTVPNVMDMLIAESFTSTTMRRRHATLATGTERTISPLSMALFRLHSW